ncbi:hypothetical protein M2651_10745 [Clostridium sp. SYSU_GA19001]|uniref:hypothetical protein n=1 Tax=Clostridium caldaquaticum TaxID=2940653 RepID=UPI002076FF10|nr:hypothetical protein [Clostridium caldaquaticum]MCM8711498.1 hypothetical protein [Clostridium caldaquaticum]
MDFNAYQNMIAKIDGVINVKIIDENEEIKEVHILANNLRAPKQIVRDIESSLMAAYGYRIDRKLISIAQIQTEDSETLRRIKYSGINLKTEGIALECSVNLIYEGEEYCELVNGIKTAANRKKIVADATVKTIEKILGQAYLFNVEDVILSSSRDINFVSVLVNMVVNEGEHIMVGSAIVRHDINEAIVKATLDAVNRRIQRDTF